jgi:hypothetical protein
MMDLAVDWLRSVLTEENLGPVTKFELSEIAPNHYQLRFSMLDADKGLPLTDEEVQGIVDGNEAIR